MKRYTREGFYTMLCSGIRGKHAKEADPLIDERDPTAEIIWAKSMRITPPSPLEQRPPTPGYWHTKPGFQVGVEFKDPGPGFISGLAKCEYQIGNRPEGEDWRYGPWRSIPCSGKHTERTISVSVGPGQNCRIQSDFGEETCRIKIRATDKAGNVSVMDPLLSIENFWIDYTPPTIEIR